jgi:hypothetical protein
MADDLESVRSKVRHAEAGLMCAVRCIQSFLFLLGNESAGMTDAQWDLQFKEAMTEAAYLMHSVFGTAPVGEVPPIPEREVPPIPAGPLTRLEFWRRGGND